MLCELTPVAECGTGRGHVKKGYVIFAAAGIFYLITRAETCGSSHFSGNSTDRQCQANQQESPEEYRVGAIGSMLGCVDAKPQRKRAVPDKSDEDSQDKCQGRKPFHRKCPLYKDAVIERCGRAVDYLSGGDVEDADLGVCAVPVRRDGVEDEPEVALVAGLERVG